MGKIFRFYPYIYRFRNIHERADVVIGPYKQLFDMLKPLINGQRLFG